MSITKTKTIRRSYEDGFDKQLSGQLECFIPRSSCAIAQIDAIREHGEGGGFEDEFLTSFFDVLGPAEGSFFHALTCVGSMSEVVPLL